MLDAELENHGGFLCFPSTAYTAGSKHLRRRIADLEYLDLQISADYCTCHDHIEGREGKSRRKEQIVYGSTASTSPPLTTTPEDIVHEESPLLPYYPDLSYVPAQRGLQGAADARHAIMELIEKMPESSYELSFNVFIKEQQSMEESRKAIMEEKQDSKNKDETEKKSENSQLKVLPQCESDNSRNFLLKLPLPLFLGSKKKSKRKLPNPPRAYLGKESEKPAKKEWWKMLCSEISEVSITDIEPNSASSSNSTNSCRWLSGGNLIPGRGCVSSRKFRGCLF